MKKFRSALATLLFAVGVVVAGGLPAHAITTYNNTTWAGAGNEESGYNFDAVEGTLTITTPHAPSISCAFIEADTSHWIGIQDFETNRMANFLIQTGFAYSDPLGTGNFTLTLWYEFLDSHGNTPVNWYDSSPGGVNVLGYTPHAGDQIFFKLWYHDSNTWGLQMEDLTPGHTGNYSAYIHDPQTGHAADYLNDEVVAVTERYPIGGQTPGLINDGTETFKQVSGHTLNTWYFQEDMTGGGVTPETYQMYNTLSQQLESASFPDSNAYAYDIWKQCV